MPFQKGHKLSPGGKKGGNGGRPSKQKKEIVKAAAQIARDYIEQHIEPVLSNYFKLAKGWDETRLTALGGSYEAFCYDGATTRHFVDKVLPDLKYDTPAAISINFIQFKSDHGALQLSAEGVSNPLLGSNGNGDQERGEGVAQAQRQGQNGLEFHSFAHVSRKRG